MSSRRSTPLISLCALAGALIFGAPSPAHALPPPQRVTASALNVRSGPGTGYAKIGLLPRGAVVQPLTSVGDWRRIVYEGRRAYVHGDYLASVSAPAPSPRPATPAASRASGRYVVNASSLNVRSGPGTGYGRVGSLPRGAVVEAEAASGVWRRVSGAGERGWVHGAYLRRVSASAPARPAPARPAPSAPAPAPAPTSVRVTPVSRTATTTRTLGSRRFAGATLRRSLTARHDARRASFETRTTVQAHAVNRTLTVVTVTRRLEVTNVSGSRPSVRRTRDVRLFGRTRITVPVETTLSRDFTVMSLSIPFALGPIPMSVRGELGASLSLSATRNVGWRGDALPESYSGSAAVGGALSLGPSVGIAEAGVEGALDVVNASLTASTRVERRALRFDVDLRVASEIRIGAYGKVGIGPFSVKKSITLA